MSYFMRGAGHIDHCADCNRAGQGLYMPLVLARRSTTSCEGSLCISTSTEESLR